MAAKRPKINRDFFKKKPNLNYKYFLWAAVGLVILVVITPLLTHRRSDKGEKILPETGVVVKEIPRSSLPGAETARPMQGVDSSVGFKEGDLQPGTAETQVTQQEGQAEQPSTLALQEGTAAVPAGPQAQQAQIASPAETLPQQTAQADAPLKGVAGDPIESQSEQVQTASLPPAQMQSAALPTAATQQSAAAPSTEDESAAEAPQETPVQGTATPTQQASLAQRSQPRKASVKPATGSGTKYIVQIGSFSQKKNADSIQQNLLKMGYQVTVRTTDHAKFGRLYVVQLSPVYELSKAELLLAKVRKEANVNPMMVKIPAGQ